MEQHLGHQTYYENLRAAVVRSAQLRAGWVPVEYAAPQLPLVGHLPRLVRGPIIGRVRIGLGLRRNPADMIFYNTQMPAVLAGQRQRERTPYVIATDITPIQMDSMAAVYHHHADRPGLMRWYKHAINRQTLHEAQHLFPWSNWTARSLRDDYGVPADRITVLPPGVDTWRWVPDTGSHDRPLQILFVGGEFGRKGGGELLRAFRALPAGSAELHIVTRATVPHEPGVFVYQNLRPNTDDLLRLYRAADLFVLPSRGEAFGIAAVEASACGLPAIITNVGGMTDVVADGESGYLIAPGDVAALTDRMRQLLDDRALLARMGCAARARAERLFDTTILTRRLEEILEQLWGVTLGAVHVSS